ncbi:peptidylprolyl isomerase [Hellea sp.]|nr:peptidylprolyl isomerase [Hellea sp.]
MLKKIYTLLSMMLMLTTNSFGQSGHGIAAVVNNDIVTTHDLRQRTLFMIATTGVKRDEESISRAQQQALRNLVDEHIQLQESDKYDQSISDEEINQSVARLIGRNGIDPNEIVGRLAEVGVSIETLRDQVRSEIAWQRIINGLYGSRVRISDAQINETLKRLTANASKPNYRVAEIFIEATPEIGGMPGAMQGAEAMIEQINEGAPFPLLAQQFSSSPTSANGGDVGWVAEGELRPEIDRTIKTMEEGSVSTPITVPGGVYVVALIGKKISIADTLYKLKQVRIDNEDINTSKTQLIELSKTLNSCDTLKSDLKNTKEVKQVDMGEMKASELTEEILTVIENTEINTLGLPIELPTGAVSIMVCSKEITGSDIPTREEIEDRLMDQQLAQASKRHLRDLRRQATIVVR